MGQPAYGKEETTCPHIHPDFPASSETRSSRSPAIPASPGRSKPWAVSKPPWTSKTTAGPDSPYEEIIDFVGELESGIDAVFVEQLGSLRPVSGVARRSEVIKGVDGNEIRLFIHEPAERKGPLRGILHTHGGSMAMCTADDPIYVRCRDEL